MGPFRCGCRGDRGGAPGGLISSRSLGEITLDQAKLSQIYASFFLFFFTGRIQPVREDVWRYESSKSTSPIDSMIRSSYYLCAQSCARCSDYYPQAYHKTCRFDASGYVLPREYLDGTLNIQRQFFASRNGFHYITSNPACLSCVLHCCCAQRA